MRDWAFFLFLFFFNACSVFNLWVSCSQEHFFLWILIPFICLPICLKRFSLGFVYTFVIVLSLVVFTPKCAPGVRLLTWPQEVIRFLGHSVGWKDGFCKGYYWTWLWFHRVIYAAPQCLQICVFYIVVIVYVCFIFDIARSSHYSTVITSAPCGCLQGNLTVWKQLIGLLPFSTTPFHLLIGQVTVTFIFLNKKTMNIHFKMNVQYLYTNLKSGM